MSASAGTLARRPGGGLIQQVTTFMARNVRAGADGSAIVTLVVFPPIFVFGFLALFSRLLERQGVDYAQFLPPAIVVQWMFSVAISAAFAYAADRRSGMLARCRILPIHRGAMLAGRLGAEALRALIAVVIIAAWGYLAGFRFHGVLWALAFIALAVAFGLVLSVGTSAVGMASTDPEATASVLHTAYIPLLMISSAFVPTRDFPNWLEPIVSVSPVTTVLDALRALAQGSVSAADLWPALAWLGGLLVVFALACARTARKVLP